MNNRFCFSLLFIVTVFNIGACQSQTPKLQLKKQLHKFLVDKKEIAQTDTTGIYIVNTLDFSKYAGETGVYKFGIQGPHYVPYLVFVENNEFQIVKDYKVTEVLKVISEFLSRNKYQDESKNVVLVENIVGVLSQRQSILKEQTIKEIIK